MRIKLTYVTPLLAAGAAAVAIVAAPAAAAAPPRSGRPASRPAREPRASRPAMLRSTTSLPPLVFIPTETCPFCSGATDTGSGQ